MTFVKPAKLSVLGLPADNNEAAKNFDYFTNDYFLNAVINGEEDLNYLDTLQRHDKSNLIVHPEWKHKIDFVGLNYYRAIYVQYNPVIALSSARFVGGIPLNDLRLEAQPHGSLNDMGWEIYPEGLHSLIMRITNQWNLPILISENGIPDKFGTNRSPFILSHISQVKRATDSGADVLGYIYWSLMDNYEWQDAYSPESRFGLYQVNRNSPDFERLPTQAVDTFKLAIAENNGASPSDSTISTDTDGIGTSGSQLTTLSNPTTEPLGPKVSISPSCGPHKGFNISVIGKGFHANSNVNWKLINSQDGIPLYGYFQTNHAGGFNDSIFADDMNADSYKIAFGHDVNNDNKFDVDTPIVFVNLEIPCH